MTLSAKRIGKARDGGGHADARSRGRGEGTRAAKAAARTKADERASTLNNAPKEGLITVARKVQIQTLDDLDGSEGASPLEFSLEGVNYEIDLNDEHAAELRELLTPYVRSARRVGKAPAKRGERERNGAPDPRTVREWARAQGIEVSNRGRVPARLIEQFEQAQAS
jgi:Lsr2